MGFPFICLCRQCCRLLIFNDNSANAAICASKRLCLRVLTIVSFSGWKAMPMSRSKPYRTRSNRPSIVASFGALRLRCLISLAASRSASLKRGSFTACETRRLLRLAAKVERFCKVPLNRFGSSCWPMAKTATVARKIFLQNQKPSIEGGAVARQGEFSLRLLKHHMGERGSLRSFRRRPLRLQSNPNSGTLAILHAFYLFRHLLISQPSLQRMQRKNLMTNRSYLQQAIKDGHAKMTGEGKNQRIHYLEAHHSERWSAPEEKVRAEFWAELIYQYEYLPERIRFEVRVPRRTPNDLADLVIYADAALKSPWFVFECKRADISDAEFTQAIEQACGNRASLGATYAGLIAGLTRRLLRFDTFPAGERDKNHIADIPKRYGQPPQWRFYKNAQGQDLAAIPREALRTAIRKCHHTPWAGGRRSPIAAFGEFCKLIFIKHRDEKDLERVTGAPYAFQRGGNEPAQQLAARIHRLYQAEQAREPGVFTEQINTDPPVLAQCVEHLEGISLDRT